MILHLRLLLAGLIIFFNLSAHAATKALPELLKFPVDQRVQLLSKSPKSAWQQLGQIAFSEEYKLSERWRAITTMGKLDAAHFKKDIEKALNNSQWFVRNAGLIAALNLDSEFKNRYSLKLLRDPALVVRTQAVRNIIALDLRSAETELWKQLDSTQNFKGKESLWIRAHIAEALANWARPGQAVAFRRMLMDEDERLHKWAIKGLEKASGYRLGDSADAIEAQRQQWLAKLGVQEI